MLNPTHIRTALLDMDGVLLDLAFDNHFWRQHLPELYGRIHGLEPDAARQRLLSWYRQEEGSLCWYDVDFWSRRLGFDVAAAKVTQAHRITVLSGVHGFLEALTAAGIRPVLITNAHPRALRLKLAVSGLGHRLHTVISVFELGVEKSDPHCWTALAARLDYDPAHTLLVEDTVANLDSAARFGIAHRIHVRRPDSGAPRHPPSDHPGVDSVSGLTPWLSADPAPGNHTGSGCNAPAPSAPRR